MKVVTVSQLNRYVKSLLESDGKLSGLYIRGELSNVTHHFRSGHVYFSLKDKECSVKGVMFRSDAQGLRFRPEDGLAVIVQARVSLYERDGAFQVYATDMQPEGVGALALAFEQRKRRLAAQGFFDEGFKKPLPPFPRVIGVATSRTGAAFQDIVNVLKRRYPLAKVLLCPALVQGEEAPASLIRAVKLLDGRCDVMIVGRGGGSAEDLWAFNDEGLAAALFGAETPVISAVGHETDFTICDFVADVRAPTPSAAAELATPSRDALEAKLEDARERLSGSARRMLAARRDKLRLLSERPAFLFPLDSVEKKRERLDFLSRSLYNNRNALFRKLGEELAHRAALLDSLSPLRVLERGYAVTYRDAEVVGSIQTVQPGDVLTVRYRDGEAAVEVREVRKGKDKSDGSEENL